MRLVRVGIVLGQSRDGEIDVGARPKSCVEKTADQTLVALPKGIRGRLLRCEYLSTCREGCASRLAVSHVEALKDGLDVLGLVDVERTSAAILSDAKTEKASNWAQVRHLVLLLQGILDMRDVFGPVAEDE